MTRAARLASPADYPVFARLFPELGVHDPLPTAESFAKHMLPRVVLVCEREEPVAYAFWLIYGTTAHVVHVVVDPAARGRGVGRALMDAVRARALEEGCTRWYLNVKCDNAPAIRMYERCGLSFVHLATAMRVEWRQLDALPGRADAVAFTPTAADDAATGARFRIPPERIAILRARPGNVLLAMREGDAIVAFGAFDPGFPGVYPLRVARPELARPLLDALRPHANMERFDYVHLTAEDDVALAGALRAVGAAVSFELMQMGGALVR